MNRPKVAIVCDWLIGGGAEKVVLELHHMFPDAPIYTSYATEEWSKKLDYKVVTGPLQSWPFSRIRKFIPFLRIWWFSSLNLNDYDLVISSSGAEAKGIMIRKSEIGNRKSKTIPNSQLLITKPLHVAYIHAPTHYYWSRYEEYLERPGFGSLDWLARLGLKVLVGPLRKWDYKAAQRPDYLIANSEHTRQAIKKYYGRDSTVIHPPVDTNFFDQLPTTNYQLPKPRRGFVVIGRQTPYKHIDLAVAACAQLDLPLTVIGNGPDHKNLRKLAGPKTTFITDASDTEIAQYLANAEAFIFPGIEDFGIAPVEALASGTPVIAYRGGGALDFVNDTTGIFFGTQSVESLIEILKNFDRNLFSESEIKKASAKFSAANFQKNMRKILTEFLPAK